MAVLATVLPIIGAVMQAGSTLAAGQQQKALAGYEADQLKVNAGQERASAQRAAMEQRRQSRLVQSRQQALAAASGAGASDPGIVDLMADTEGEGEFRALTELWTGEERARSLKSQAAATEFEGRMRNRQAQTKAFTTLLSAGSSLYSRYGEGGYG